MGVTFYIHLIYFYHRTIKMKYLKPILAIISLLNKLIPLQVKKAIFIGLAKELAKSTKTDIDDKLIAQIEKKLQ